MAKKVLVVDDEKLIVKGIRFSLEQDNMEVDCAYDGEEALAFAKNCEYDLVLLDVKHPDPERFEIIAGQPQDTLLALIDIINAHKKHVWVRHVVVPDINDTPEDMEALNVFMKKIRFVDKVELLGYHTMAVEKYGKLGITYRLKGVPPMDSARLMELQKLIHKPAEAVTRMSL